MKRYEETRWGFIWNNVSVCRLHSDEKGGSTIEIATPKQSFQIRVTKTGRIRVYPFRKTGADWEHER